MHCHRRNLTPPEIVNCDCPKPPPPADRKAVAKCTKCGSLLHKLCMTRTPSHGSFVESVNCVLCRQRKVKELGRGGGWEVRKDTMVRENEEKPDLPREETRAEPPRRSQLAPCKKDGPFLPKALPPARGSPEEDLNCDCESPPLEDGVAYLTCCQCHVRQHIVCMLNFLFSHEDDEKIPAQLCNACKIAALHDIIAFSHRKTREWQRAVLEKRAEVKELVSRVVWRQYCLLPDGQANAMVLTATKTVFRASRTEPVYVAPVAWVDEVCHRLEKMMGAVSEEDLCQVFGSGSAAAFWQGDILLAWSQIATWLTSSRGPWRSQRHELGILAEVLGLKEKGACWKGEGL